MNARSGDCLVRYGSGSISLGARPSRSATCSTKTSLARAATSSVVFAPKLDRPPKQHDPRRGCSSRPDERAERHWFVDPVGRQLGDVLGAELHVGKLVAPAHRQPLDQAEDELVETLPPGGTGPEPAGLSGPGSVRGPRIPRPRRSRTEPDRRGDTGRGPGSRVHDRHLRATAPDVVGRGHGRSPVVNAGRRPGWPVALHA